MLSVPWVLQLGLQVFQIILDSRYQFFPRFVGLAEFCIADMFVCFVSVMGTNWGSSHKIWLMQTCQEEQSL